MPEPVNLSYAIGLPPEDAINYFRQKGYTFSWNWHDVWQDAHAKSFTVAKAMKLDLLQDIRGAVDKALANGTTLATFREELEPLLKKKGWWGKDEATGAQLGSGHRMETIFRTNLQSSYMAGRYKQQVENADDRPYWQYISVMDSRTRPAHAELNGKVFRFDDVFWNTHYPPLGFNCRCRTRAYTEKQVKDKGLTVESGTDNMVWEDKRINKETTRPVSGYKDPKTGKVTFTDPGWSSNPGKEHWQIDLSKYDKKLQDIANKAAEPWVKDRSDLTTWIKENFVVHGDYKKEVNIVFTRDQEFFMSTNRKDRITISDYEHDVVLNGKAVKFNAAESLINAMKAIGNRKLSFNEEYSIECLWHEVIHSNQVVNPDRLNQGTRLYFMETINQWQARRSYQIPMLEMDTKPLHQKKIIKSGYGYGSFVSRFDKIISKLGLDEYDVGRLIANTHSLVENMDYIEEISVGFLDKARGKGYNKKTELIDIQMVMHAISYSESDFKKALKAI